MGNSARPTARQVRKAASTLEALVRQMQLEVSSPAPSEHVDDSHQRHLIDQLQPCMGLDLPTEARKWLEELLYETQAGVLTWTVVRRNANMLAEELVSWADELREDLPSSRSRPPSITAKLKDYLDAPASE